jgi:hypothetical protein
VSPVQPAPTIEHSPLGCVDDQQYTRVAAVFDPDNELKSAKVYFRAAQYPDFYYVMMELEAGEYRAYLPLPDDQTSRVVYYIEVVDTMFGSSRTVEYDPEVMRDGECRRRDPTAAWFVGENPNIVVGALSQAASALPSGFQAAGITGFVSATGAVSGVGGTSFGLLAGVAAGAAGAGTVGALAAGSDESATTTTTQTPMRTSGGSTTTTIVGSTPTTTTTTTTAPATTTSAPPTTTTTSAQALAACFTASDADGPAGCAVAFNASCSTGSIDTYTWFFSDNPPSTEVTTSPTITYDWSDESACGSNPNFSRLVRLTVTAGGSTASVEQTIRPVNPSGLTILTQTLQRAPTHFTSRLDSFQKQGRSEAHVLVNQGQLDVVGVSTPFRHRLVGRKGRNTVEAYLTSPKQGEMIWSFDFSMTEGFVPGSLKAEKGSVLSQSETRIAVRLSGSAGERIQLSFQLRP